MEYENKYDKMPEYISSVYNVYLNVNKIAIEKKNNRLLMTNAIIKSYCMFLSNTYKVALTSDERPTTINLIPIFEYIAANNIELYDFSNMHIDELNVHKKADLERYVLSHIYYITQDKQIHH